MAGYKGKDKTISSVSDILGFVLEQSELPPEQRKPVRPPPTADSQASSEYVQTLVDALAMPGMFVGDQFLGAMQGLVDPTIKVGVQTSRIPVVKLTASGLPDFFEKPDEFIDKLFETNKTISKMENIRWAGEAMRYLAGSTYAKKMGLFEGYGDLKNTLERAVGQAAQDSGSPRDRQWIVRASEELRKDGYVSRTDVRKLIARKNKVDENTRKGKELKEKLTNQINSLNGMEGINALEASLKNLNKKTDSKRWEDTQDNIDKITDTISSAETFRSLLGLEFEERQNDLLGNRTKSQLTAKELVEYNKLESSNNILELWKKYDTLDARAMKGAESLDGSKDEGILFKLKRAKSNIRSNEEELRDRLKAIRSGKTFGTGSNLIDYGKLSKSQKRAEISVAQKNIKQLRSTRRSLNSVQLWSGIGAAEGLYYGVKQTFGPGGIEAILNGDFYNPIKGYYGCPVDNAGTILIGKGKWNKVEFVKSKSAEISYKRNLRDAYNDGMVRFYYMNPATWVKSMFTGEGFAWVADNKKIEIKKMWSVKSGVFKELQDPKFWKFYKKYKKLNSTEQIQLLAKEPKYRNILGYVLKGLGDENSAFAKKFFKAEKISNALEQWSKVTAIFSTPARMLSLFQEKTLGKVQTGIRKGVFSVLSKLKFFTKDKAAMALLTSWKATGGAALSSAISQGIVAAFGLAGTAIAGPLGTAVTVVVAWVMEGVTKLSIKVIVYAFVGVFGLILLIGASSEYSNRASVDSYSREIPGTIYENKGFGGYGGFSSGYLYSSGNFVPPPINIPAPTNSSCPFGDVKYRCTQGFSNTKCSHKNITNLYPVDLAGMKFFFAPQYCDTSTCTAKLSSMAAWRCTDGGFTGWNIEFSDGQGNVFNLMHTKLIPPGNGRNYKAGEPVAYIYQYAAEIVADDPLGTTRPNKNGVFYCWTGAHVHLTITHNGQYIDPIAFLVDMGCVNGVQSESKCPPCRP
ncbi:hypothetical protein K8R20_02910 [bacterium]|nr:hypothetical protein [bacterium]